MTSPAHFPLARARDDSGYPVPGGRRWPDRVASQRPPSRLRATPMPASDSTLGHAGIFPSPGRLGSSRLMAAAMVVDTGGRVGTTVVGGGGGGVVGGRVVTARRTVVGGDGVVPGVVGGGGGVVGGGGAVVGGTTEG